MRLLCVPHSLQSVDCLCEAPVCPSLSPVCRLPVCGRDSNQPVQLTGCGAPELEGAASARQLTPHSHTVMSRSHSFTASLVLIAALSGKSGLTGLHWEVKSCCQALACPAATACEREHVLMQDIFMALVSSLEVKITTKLNKNSKAKTPDRLCRGR